MTSIDKLDLESESISHDTSKLLDDIAPTPKKMSTFFPIIIAIIIAIVVYVVNSTYFMSFFSGVQYLSIVQSALIFSISLLLILYFF